MEGPLQASTELRANIQAEAVALTRFQVRHTHTARRYLGLPGECQEPRLELAGSVPAHVQLPSGEVRRSPIWRMTPRTAWLKLPKADIPLPLLHLWPHLSAGVVLAGAAVAAAAGPRDGGVKTCFDRPGPARSPPPQRLPPPARDPRAVIRAHCTSTLRSTQLQQTTEAIC